MGAEPGALRKWASHSKFLRLLGQGWRGAGVGAEPGYGVAEMLVGVSGAVEAVRGRVCRSRGRARAQGRWESQEHIQRQ